MVFVLLALLLAFFLWLLKDNFALRETWKQKKQELEEAQAASRRLEALERQSQELKQKENTLYNRIPLGEKQPFGLIKKLINLGGQIGLREMNISLKEKEESQIGQASAGAPAGPKAVHLQMNVVGTFRQLLDFLKKIYQLERVVNVSLIEVKRSEKLLPYQKISLELIVYTF